MYVYWATSLIVICIQLVSGHVTLLPESELHSRLHASSLHHTAVQSAVWIRHNFLLRVCERTELFGVSSELLYSLNISMWLSHDCAVPVKKAWEEQGRALWREEPLWKLSCHWLLTCSACLQKSARLAGALH